jgi:hypothetical protein
MSERATYCTNYICNTDMLEKLEDVLPNYRRITEGIYNFGYISGSFKAYYSGEEYTLFEETYLNELMKRNLGGRVRITLIPEAAPIRIYILENNEYRHFTLEDFDT